MTVLHRSGLKAVLDTAVETHGAPGIVAEVHRGRTSWSGSAGTSDIGVDRERSLAEHFRIGGATKTFTATVVMQLAGEGRLDLDDTVEQWLPGLVHGNGHDGSRIRIRQLLNHTSGVFDYPHDPGWKDLYAGEALLEHLFDHFDPARIVEIALSNPPAFAPGEGWCYSDTGYFLAGMIVEKISGRTLAEEIQRRVTSPLGLTGTHLPTAETTVPDPHPGHYTILDPRNPEIYDVTDLNTSFAWAAGGMISTTGDLAAFMSALLGGRLLPPAQQREMFTTVPTTPECLPHAEYGLGVLAQRLSNGRTVWGNGGSIFGSWVYAMGSRGGTRMVVSHINSDWTPNIEIFTDILEAELGGEDSSAHGPSLVRYQE